MYFLYIEVEGAAVVVVGGDMVGGVIVAVQVAVVVVEIADVGPEAVAEEDGGKTLEKIRKRRRKTEVLKISSKTALKQSNN